MNRLKDLWGGQDAINRVAFIAAIAAFAWCIVQGHGMYGVVFAVVILFLIISRQNQREKRFSRLYGTMYFPMPDGELVPRSFEQVKNEYVHGAQSNYADRKVELRFPWWYLNSAGDIDTGFGLTVRIGDKQELAPGRQRPRGGHAGGREPPVLLHRQAGGAAAHLRKGAVPAEGKIKARLRAPGTGARD